MILVVEVNEKVTTLDEVVGNARLSGNFFRQTRVLGKDMIMKRNG